jgi:hypothetical protein
MIISRRMEGTGFVTRMGQKRGAYRVLVGKLQGKRTLGKPWYRWDNNITVDLK